MTRLKVSCLCTIVNHRWPGAKIVTAHCHNPVFQTMHQPGGIAQFVFQKLTGCIIDHGWDKLGHYAWQTILIDGTHNLVIIMAYHITQENISNCRYIMSAMQQWQKLKTAGIKNPNPWQQILIDLGFFVKTYIANGNEMIIMIDANSSSNDSTIAKFLDDTLIWFDAWLSSWPTTQYIPTQLIKNRSYMGYTGSSYHHN